jgi:hypothetical protein
MPVYYAKSMKAQRSAELREAADTGRGGARVAAEVKTCINCGKPLGDRVEEEQRSGFTGSASTGECQTYRVWSCVNPDCVMFNTDLYRDQIGQS